ncbi:MAG: FecR domain-containing protein [Spirochaetales bacterium]
MRSFLLVLMTLIAASLFGQITVVEADGVVEAKINGTWQGVAAGDQLSGNTIIATGFRSQAILEIGSSRVTVEPLSEVQVSELAVGDNTERANLALPFGRIRAEVNKDPNVTRSLDFRIQSPVSTAAVRGTTFVYDGVELVVVDGRVDLANAYGQWHSVAEGQVSRAYRWDISSVETVAGEAARGE